MSQPDSDHNKKIVKGKSSPVRQDFHQYTLKGGGAINTNIQDINWTPKKLILTITLLGIPYGGIVLACFIAGINIIAYMLIGLAIFVGILFLIVRSLEQ
ncbi:MAG: hypothetical protein ACFCU5_15885 [Pleurocapsa sp.]